MADLLGEEFRKGEDRYGLRLYRDELLGVAVDYRLMADEKVLRLVGTLLRLDIPGFCASDALTSTATSCDVRSSTLARPRFFSFGWYTIVSPTI
jgi:hypothetical protein